MQIPAHYQSLEFDRVRKLITVLAAHAGRPLRVLDFGCGRAKYLDCLSSLGCQVTGIDANPAYVAEAEAKGYSAYPSLDLLPDESRRFDVVFLSHVIEHLPPDELVEFVPRLCRLLTEEGRMVIVT